MRTTVNNMKKFLTLLIVCSLLVICSSCSTNKTESAKENSTQQSSSKYQEIEKATSLYGEPSNLKDVYITHNESTVDDAQSIIFSNLNDEYSRIYNQLSSNGGSFDAGIPARLRELINNARIENGKQPLLAPGSSDSIYKIALARAAMMAITGSSSKDLPNYGSLKSMCSTYGVSAGLASENILITSDASVESLNDMLSGSINDIFTSDGYTHVAIAVAKMGGETFVCEVFYSQNNDTSYEFSITPTLEAITDMNNYVKDHPMEDFDDDGLVNSEELKYGTDPRSPDTDMDGVCDYAEIHIGKYEGRPTQRGTALEDRVNELLEKNNISVNTPFKIHDVIMWADDLQSRSHGTVVLTIRGYRFINFNGWIQFPKSCYAYMVDKNKHLQALKYDERYNTWRIDSQNNDIEVILYTLPIEANNGKTAQGEDLGSVTVTEPVMSKIDKTDMSRFGKATYDFEDLTKVYTSIKSGRTVAVSLQSPTNGEVIGMIYGFTDYGDLLFADEDGNRTSIDGEMYILDIKEQSAITIDQNGDLCQREYFDFSGLGFNSENGDKMHFIFSGVSDRKDKEDYNIDNSFAIPTLIPRDESAEQQTTGTFVFLQPHQDETDSVNSKSSGNIYIKEEGNSIFYDTLYNDINKYNGMEISFVGTVLECKYIETLKFYRYAVCVDKNPDSIFWITSGNEYIEQNKKVRVEGRINGVYPYENKNKVKSNVPKIVVISIEETGKNTVSTEKPSDLILPSFKEENQISIKEGWSVQSEQYEYQSRDIPSLEADFYEMGFPPFLYVTDNKGNLNQKREKSFRDDGTLIYLDMDDSHYLVSASIEYEVPKAKFNSTSTSDYIDLFIKFIQIITNREVSNEDRNGLLHVFTNVFNDSESKNNSITINDLQFTVVLDKFYNLVILKTETVENRANNTADKKEEEDKTVAVASFTIKNDVPDNITMQKAFQLKRSQACFKLDLVKKGKAEYCVE